MNSRFTWYAGFIMSVIYLVFGGTLLFTNFLPHLISNSRIIGGVIFGYGVFRLVISIQKRKKYLQDEE